MQNDNDPATALLEKIMFDMCRRSEMHEATLARFETTLEQASEIRQQQAVMSAALDRLEAGQK